MVVVAYSMARELKRTLYSLSPKYQRGVNGDEYEVIVVDNGSIQAIRFPTIQRPGWSVQLLCRPPGDVSPCRAVNAGVAQARAEHVCVMVDGARMVSPGLIAGLLAIFRADADAFAITLGWHLGPQPQNISILQGYNQGVEDRMLRKARWREDGYRLFSISSLALSSAGGWFAPITESNCFALKRHHFQALGGFDERFVAPGGGLVNLDFFRQAIAAKQLKLAPGCCWGKAVSIRSMAAWPPTCRWSSIQAWPSARSTSRSAVSPTTLRSTTLNTSVRSPR